MGSGKVSFELVVPERLLMSTAIDMVVVPGSEGDFGVLEGHAPLISQMRPGVIEIYDGDNISDRVFVTGGFAEVTQERCTVLADEAIRVADLDTVAIDQRIILAERAVSEASDNVARIRAESDCAVALAMREAVV